MTDDATPGTCEQLAPSPTEQVVLNAPPHTEPLPDLCDQAVQADLAGEGA